MKMKRKLALLTSAVMLLGSLNVTAFAAGSGDVNGDGNVNEDDASLIMQYVLNPGSLTEEQRTLIAAEGDTSTDCIEYTANTAADGTVIGDHLITAKDAAFILQQSLIESVFVDITAGKVDGAKVFKPISYEGATTEEAQKAAQDEIASLTISEYFNKYIEKFDSVSDTRIDQVNDFLNKVYINDWALASDNGRAWIEAYLNVNDSTNAFFETAYKFASNGVFDVSTVDDAKTLFTALQGVKLTDADVQEIKDRINGEGNYTFADVNLIPTSYGYTTEDAIPALWFRTTFKVNIYDVVNGVEKNVVDSSKTMSDDYRDHGYSVEEWYYYNRSGGDKIIEQYFTNNILNAVDLVAKAVNLVSSDAKVIDLVNLIGGDRITVEINQGTLPSVAKNAGNYATLEEFTEALGGFDDPTNTYYLDFSALGYDF